MIRRIFAVGAVATLTVGAAFLVGGSEKPSATAAGTRGRLPRAAARPRPLTVIVPPERISDTPLPELPSLKSYVVLDVRSGAPILAHNPDRVLPVASLTKLATALVITGANPIWSERVMVLEDDLREGSEPILVPGESVTREELFAAALIGSSNVATAVSARATGLTPQQFVSRMNHVAETLGLHQTKFFEPTGLDERNVSTAREISYLARAAFGDLRIGRHALAPSVVLHPVPVKSPKLRLVRATDALLASELTAPPYSFRGGKTGSLGEPGTFHFAMVVGNGQRRDIVVVVLGADDAYTRFDAAKSLARWTFNTHRWEEYENSD